MMHITREELEKLQKDLNHEPFELLPHVISLEIQAVDIVKSNYQVIIEHIPEFFLLKHIQSRTLTNSIRLVRNSKIMYEAPGWLHHFGSFESTIEPALYMSIAGQWMFTVDYERSVGQHINNMLEFALIGYRASRIE